MNYTLDKPKGIDYAIQRMQNHLFKKLGWSNFDIYGRVYKNISKKSGQVVPEAYIGNGEYKDVLTNDKKDAMVFFVDADEHTSISGHTFTSEVSVVFIVNLKKLYPNAVNRADTDVQIHADKIIRGARIFNVTANTPITITKGLENVLSEFDTTNIKLSDFQPYHIFSIKGTLNYLITNC